MTALLEVVLALAYVYLLLSLAVGALREVFAQLLGLRAKHLTRIMKRMLDGPTTEEKSLFGHELLRGVREGSVSYLEARTFAAAILDQLVSGAGTEQAEADRIDEVLMPPGGEQTPDGVRAVLRALWRRAHRDVALFREEVETWFDESMRGATDSYRQSSYGWMLVLSIFVVGVGNVDTLRITRELWVDSAARELIVAAAAERVQAGAPGEPIELAALRDELEAFGFPWGWPGEDLPKGTDILWWMSKLIGLSVTALAVSLGTPFWYDALQRLVALRRSSATRPAPKDEADEAVG